MKITVYRYIYVYSILFHAWKLHRLRYNKYKLHLRNFVIAYTQIRYGWSTFSAFDFPHVDARAAGEGEARPICRLIGPGHGGLNIRPRSSTRCVYASSATN